MRFRTIRQFYLFFNTKTRTQQHIYFPSTRKLRTKLLNSAANLRCKLCFPSSKICNLPRKIVDISTDMLKAYLNRARKNYHDYIWNFFRFLTIRRIKFSSTDERLDSVGREYLVSISCRLGTRTPGKKGTRFSRDCVKIECGNIHRGNAYQDNALEPITESLTLSNRIGEAAAVPQRK